MQLFLGVMTKDTRVRSTNHPTLKLLERVVVTLMEMVKEKIVETTFPTKILRMLRQDSFIDLTAQRRLKTNGGKIGLV